jgi:hypothetical protein
VGLDGVPDGVPDDDDEGAGLDVETQIALLYTSQHRDVSCQQPDDPSIVTRLPPMSSDEHLSDESSQSLPSQLHCGILFWAVEQ